MIPWRFCLIFTPVGRKKLSLELPHLCLSNGAPLQIPPCPALCSFLCLSTDLLYVSSWSAFYSFTHSESNWIVKLEMGRKNNFHPTLHVHHPCRCHLRSSVENLVAEMLEILRIFYSIASNHTAARLLTRKSYTICSRLLLPLAVFSSSSWWVVWRLICASLLVPLSCVGWYSLIYFLFEIQGRVFLSSVVT